MDKNKWYEFKPGCFHMGHYLDTEGADCLWNIENPEWNFDDDDDDEPGFAYQWASALAMGACNIFAIALAKNTNLKTYNWFSKTGSLIHAFGITTYNGLIAYVDARGATTDFEEFVKILRHNEEEFNPVPQDAEEEYRLMDEDAPFGYHFAEYIIHNFPDCYPFE